MGCLVFPRECHAVHCLCAGSSAILAQTGLAERQGCVAGGDLQGSGCCLAWHLHYTVHEHVARSVNILACSCNKEICKHVTAMAAQ